MEQEGQKTKAVQVLPRKRIPNVYRKIYELQPKVPGNRGKGQSEGKHLLWVHVYYPYHVNETLEFFHTAQ